MSLASVKAALDATTSSQITSSNPDIKSSDTIISRMEGLTLPAAGVPCAKFV